jgi:hypothetical protein
MRNKFLILLLLILTSTSGFSQDIQLYANNVDTSRKNSNPDDVKKYRFKSYRTMDEADNIPLNLVGSHPFGEKIARKSYLLDKKYVMEEELTPGNPATKVIIRKPAVYESVKSIERELKRAVRKEEISITEATVAYDYVLDVALNIVTADTDEFESELLQNRSPKSKLEIFTNRVEIYF